MANSEVKNLDSDDETFYDANEGIDKLPETGSNANVEAQTIEEKLKGIDVNDAVEEEILTEEEKEDLRRESMKLKDEGNEEFKSQKFKEAGELYTQGLNLCPKCYTKERSIMFANRAACLMSMDQKKEAILDCTDAIDLNPKYVKALFRRAQLYEDTEKLDEALQDYQKILEIDPSLHRAREACMRLPDQINIRNEKLKDEMMGNLKKLGNSILGKFGLSTDNFQMEQNPETGGYNVQFKQNS